jgi:para-aminobenzoate synthetase/4-amino-4-deoxychorismate lyase
VAGFLGYEAARGFGLPTRDPESDGAPLVWLGVFGPPEAAAGPAAAAGTPPPPLDTWRPGLDAPAYAAAVARIREHLAAGDTYQVNLTFPLEAPLVEEPQALFARLVAVQRGRHAAFGARARG